MNPRDTAIREYRKHFGRQPDFIARAPGRVNLLGEHVDYNDGFVLPVAIDREVAIAFGPSGDDSSTVLAADFQHEVNLHPANLAARIDRGGQDLPGWALYPAGIQHVLQAEGLLTPGMQAVFSADVPRGAGLSSSAAVEMAFMMAWQMLGGWQRPAAVLAGLAQRAESQYVGVRCGIMDQYASACGRQGHAIYLDCRDLTSRYVALPPDLGIIIADSGIRHSLADGSYNERRAACEQAVHLLRKWLPGIRALRDVSMEQLDRYGPRLPEGIHQAARHVVGEIVAHPTGGRATRGRGYHRIWQARGGKPCQFTGSVPGILLRTGLACTHRPAATGVSGGAPDGRRLWRLHDQPGLECTGG